MRLAEKWRAARQTVDQELDERARQASLLVTRDAFVVVFLVTFGYATAIAAWPMSDESRLAGYGLLPLVMMTAAAVTFTVSQRRHGRPTLELQKAIGFQALLLVPPIALAIAAILYALGRDLGEVLGVAFGLIVGILIQAGVNYRRSRKHADTDRDTDV